jgi:hypothetical protein
VRRNHERAAALGSKKLQSPPRFRSNEICLTTYEKAFERGLLRVLNARTPLEEFVLPPRLEEDLEVGDERALSQTTNSALANQT